MYGTVCDDDVCLITLLYVFWYCTVRINIPSHQYCTVSGPTLSRVSFSLVARLPAKLSYKPGKSPRAAAFFVVHGEKAAQAPARGAGRSPAVRRGRVAAVCGSKPWQPGPYRARGLPRRDAW